MTSESRQDLLGIWVYISRDNEGAADDFVDRLTATCRKLADNPGLGRNRPDLSTGLRSFPVGNYLIIYRATPGGARIIRVLHGARDIPELF
jgi:toxin ParE1/3/4